MKARKTASFGAAYNYSQITYPEEDMPKLINDMCQKIKAQLGFLPNNS